MTRETGSVLQGVPSVTDPCLCDNKGRPSGDHLAVYFSAKMRKPSRVQKRVTFRRLRNICVPDFITGINGCSLLHDTDKPVDELVDAYSSGIQALIDKYAPLCTKVITLRPHAPGTRMFCVRLNMSVGRENGCGVEQG